MTHLTERETDAFTLLDSLFSGESSFLAVAEHIAERAYADGLCAGRASVMGELAWWGATDV
jgi:hypothetical protein